MQHSTAHSTHSTHSTGAAAGYLVISKNMSRSKFPGCFLCNFICCSVLNWECRHHIYKIVVWKAVEHYFPKWHDSMIWWCYNMLMCYCTVWRGKVLLHVLYLTTVCISVFDAGTMEVMGQVLHVSWSWGEVPRCFHDHGAPMHCKGSMVVLQIIPGAILYNWAKAKVDWAQKKTSPRYIVQV